MQSSRFEAPPRRRSSVIGALLLPVAATLAMTDAARSQPRIEQAVAGLEWRPLGPAVTGGRIADVAVVESRPATFFVGTASGGVWKTVNHGTSWEPLFDDQPTASIGDVTLAPSNPHIVWVGTGEPQNRQSSPWGNGVYKSTDGGGTWTHAGLDDTHHIGRIIIHPGNPDIVYVAAVGHLWGPNSERGVFKTSDGGGNWEKVLFVDENTGAIDLATDPGDPETLFAAMYQRRRTGFGFNGGGPGSGIYRTTDGGANWRELTDGLPPGVKGRIGLDVYRRDGNLVYAVVEADPRRSFGTPAPPNERPMGGVFRSTDRGETWEQMSGTNPRPMYYSQIRIDPNDPERIYLGGTQLMVSEDGGKTFRNDGAPGIHVDHHALWIDPNDSDHLIIGNDGGVSASFDRGATWRMYDNLPIGQFYQIGVDMRDPYYVCGGLQDNSSWCGPSATLTTYGIRNGDWYDVWGGDGFYNLVDPNDPTIVFSESQGGNVGRIDITTGEETRIRPEAEAHREAAAAEEDEEEDRSYRWNWNAPIVMSSHDPRTIYIGANVLLRSRDRGATWEEVSPDLTKQIDRSELEIMGLTEDKMLSRHDGISSYGNLTSVSESPLDRELLYVGTDDGNLQRTRDGGATWTNLISNVGGVPERTYVSRVTASRHAAGTVYLTFDGHRNDDYKSHVYVSDDYGEHWRSIAAGLPDWSVNAIVEHPRAPNLLFVGNEVGVYFSAERGETWMRLKNNLPTVPVDDIVVHPRENDLILGTHGRSIWILEDITPLEHLTDEVLASSAHVFPVRPATMYSLKGGWPFKGANYAAPNPPYGAVIRYYLGQDVAHEETVAPAPGTNGSNGGDVLGRRPGDDEAPTATLTVFDGAGETVRELEGSGKAGIQQVVWDLRLPPPYEPEEGQQGGGGGGGFFGSPRGPKVLPGTYTVRLEAAGQTHSTDLVVEGDPRIQISAADLSARQSTLVTLYALNKTLHQADQAVQRLREQIEAVQQLLRDAPDTPENLTDGAKTLNEDIRELGREISQARRDARVFGAIDGSTTKPTADQQWQAGRLWEDITGLVDRVNDIITNRMPALNRQLNEHGVRPRPGEPIKVPIRPGE
jgi:photosystem II stability/assembly factor-like uncharacterized protein